MNFSCKLCLANFFLHFFFIVLFSLLHHSFLHLISKIKYTFFYRHTRTCVIFGCDALKLKRNFILLTSQESDINLSNQIRSALMHTFMCVFVQTTLSAAVYNVHIMWKKKINDFNACIWQNPAHTSHSILRQAILIFFLSLYLTKLLAVQR
jgi:hypothetical protein